MHAAGRTFFVNESNLACIRSIGRVQRQVVTCQIGSLASSEEPARYDQMVLLQKWKEPGINHIEIHLTAGRHQSFMFVCI